MLIIPGLVYGKLLGEVGKKIQEAYGVAGGIVEQAVSSIRTVYSYVAEERTAKDYKNALKPALELGIKQGLMKGMAIGTVGITFAVWALQGWYGSTLVINRGAKGGNVFTAGLCIIYGGLSLGGSLINVKYFIEANIAAARIFEMIHRVPGIDSADEQGKTISDVKGEVEFRDIEFEYPSRPGSLVLNKFNLKVMSGQTVGLVGTSGSGKSTVINLLERFYEPLRGDILLDGVDIKTLQLKWLRNQMGLEPKILLLDEATSALDSISEKAVQDALNQASIGRTTIIIAHHLSALRNADLIAVIQSGQVGEFGSHEQLIQNSSGTYAVMVKLQRTYMNDEVLLEAEDTEDGSAFPVHDGTIRVGETPDKSLSRNSSFGMITNQQQEDDSSPNLRQLISMTAPEWKSTLLGCVGALGYGLIPPLNSFCLGALLAVYFENDHAEIRSQTRIYCFAFLAFAVFTFLTNVIQHYYFGIMGEKLTERVREAVFEKILTFEIEWFDQENNSSGAICARLATDAVMVRTLVTDRLSLLTQAVSSATLAVVLALMLSWRLALVAIALEPGVIAAVYLREMTMRIMSKKILKAQSESSELASEAFGNHKIITAFGSQEKVLKLYDRTQVSSKKESNKQSWYAGVGLFVSQFLTSALIAVICWYGGKLLFQKKITYKHLFQIFFILVSTGRVIAETASMTADLSKGTSALKSVFQILQRETKMDPENPDGIKTEKINGEIEFKQVYFIYPARPKQIILRGLDLKIEAAKFVALVGRSGSGKSTIIRLIEGFYDTLSGSIEVDGIDIMRYNLRALRSLIALVSQEPTLFAGTIRDNIAYAKQNATEAEIIEASSIANAHEFISSLRDGYETYCGERGVQLSGGQKQRIALARAILKNPAILLLDEATSALDVNSEKLVQEALERTMSGRTSLVLAHRLSTIQKADKIVVIDKGRVIEEGNHSELLALGEKGAYYALVKLQQLSVI
uniref:ABC transporter family protein n=2 Tax=Populus trichocarpa TaxID=3694 RepID=A0A2K1ZYE2_POPTR